LAIAPTPRFQLPPRLLPVLYFGAAHAALALAFAAIALDPRGVSGFFYHARMLAIVHLVTLGWITASILGSLYIVGPIALGVRFPATWIGYTAFGLVLIGIVGMVSHFWLDEYGGMAWSAVTAGAGILAAGASIVRQLPGATLPRAVSAHIVLAFVNVLGAATLGMLLGFDKVYHFLPGYVLANVFAHAHLAAPASCSWASRGSSWHCCSAAGSPGCSRRSSWPGSPRSSSRSPGCCGARARGRPGCASPIPRSGTPPRRLRGWQSPPRSASG
jgi:hypothetical protein